jgi:hypothetical protein
MLSMYASFVHSSGFLSIHPEMKILCK